MKILYYIIAWLCVYAISVVFYLAFNKGLIGRAIKQQMIRFCHTSFFAVAALGILQVDLFSVPMIPVWGIFLLWGITYPLLEYLTNKNSSIEINNIFDIVFAIDLLGFLGTLTAVISSFSGIVSTILQVILAVLEFVLILVPLCQIVYYILYRVSIDANGMQILQETHYNEVIEYVKAFPIWGSIAIVALFVTVFAGCIQINLYDGSTFSWWQYVLSLAIEIFEFCYAMFGGLKGVFRRIGVVRLFDIVAEYCENNAKYTAQTEKRLEDIAIEKLSGDFSKPSTIVMVIGESASRDYMSAYTDYQHDTTPWQRECRKDESHFMFIDNAYSCGVQTVPALERALTEKNQYNNNEFYESCSVVDIAHKLGYTVHWYSNQGHLGAADTPITLVANTANVAKWTKQELNTVQYDESLLEFLDEIDPAKNNFVVLHLKGNHVNFINRYPADRTVWGEPNVWDDILNYENSIHYTDSVLKSFYDYAKEKLNMQAFVFFSDHACIPDKRRCPNFDGFGMTRIPMFVYLSDEYQQLHKERSEMLLANKNKFFSNDLIYELMCGIFDVRSNHFDESNCLASNLYKYTRETVLTNEGRTHVSEDKLIKS